MHKTLAIVLLAGSSLWSSRGSTRNEHNCNVHGPKELARLGNNDAAATAYAKLLYRYSCPTDVWIAALIAANRVRRQDLIPALLAHLSHASHLTKAQADLVRQTAAKNIATNRLVTKARTWPRRGLAQSSASDTWWALRAVTGRQLTAVAIGAPIRFAPLTTDGKTFYVTDATARLHAVRRSGILWSTALLAEQSGPALLWKLRLFIPLANGSVACMQAKTGRRMWKISLDREPCTSLAVDGTGRLWALCGSGVHVLNCQGLELARLAHRPCRAGPVPWGDDCVAIGCRNGSIERICLSRGAGASTPLRGQQIARCGTDVTRLIATHSGALVATAEPAKLCVVDHKLGLLWQTPTPGSPTAGPLLDQRRVIVGTQDGFVVAYS